MDNKYQYCNEEARKKLLTTVGRQVEHDDCIILHQQETFICKWSVDRAIASRSSATDGKYFRSWKSKAGGSCIRAAFRQAALIGKRFITGQYNFRNQKAASIDQIKILRPGDQRITDVTLMVADCSRSRQIWVRSVYAQLDLLWQLMDGWVEWNLSRIFYCPSQIRWSLYCMPRPDWYIYAGTTNGRGAGIFAGTPILIECINSELSYRNQVPSERIENHLRSLSYSIMGLIIIIIKNTIVYKEL